MKDYAQQTLHLSSVISEKISNLDNAVSFSERKRDFCKKISDNALLAREYAYMDTTQDNIAYPITPKLLEYLNTNRVSTYKGITLVELPQVFKNQLPNMRERLIPDDKILVVGGNAGEILMYGGVEYQDYTDMTIQPADYIHNSWMSYVIIVDMPENLGVIKLT
jgi:hypothetical protein